MGEKLLLSAKLLLASLLNIQSGPRWVQQVIQRHHAHHACHTTVPGVSCAGRLGRRNGLRRPVPRPINWVGSSIDLGRCTTGMCGGTAMRQSSTRGHWETAFLDEHDEQNSDQRRARLAQLYCQDCDVKQQRTTAQRCRRGQPRVHRSKAHRKVALDQDLWATRSDFWES